MFISFLVCGLTIFSLFVGTGRERPQNPLTLKVYPTVSFQSPAYIRLTTRVEPDQDNRSICVFIGGDGDYEASACRDIGTTPITTEWKWWVPTGEYEAVAVLSTTYGVVRTALKFSVKGHDESVPEGF